MTQFKFRALEEADAIRLLVLYPSHETTAPLSGSLINTTLSACDSDFANGYLALSYVWGKPASTSSIHIDGIAVGITDNLAEALTQVRNAYPGAPQRIWADALCINQSDTAEKNRQVPLMGNIYSLAKTTVIYLGPLSPGIDTIFKAVHDSKPKYVTVDAAGNSRIALAKDVQQLKKFDVKAGSEPPAAAIDELLQRPWFTRVWVTQELLLSRDAWVQCGALRVRWRELGALLVPILDRTKGKGITALQQMHSLGLDGEDIMAGARPKSSRKTRKAAEEKKASLSRILRMRQGYHASDPRDMIFGYMGMHADRDEVAEFFTVDYEMPLRQLLILTARYIHYRDGLEVLLRCVKRLPTNNWLNLPSWVPDWGIHEWSQATSNTNATNSEEETLPSTVEKCWKYLPHQDPKFIRYISPILPRPQDVPQCVVDLVKRAFYTKFKWREEREFLEVERISFWRDLDIGSSESQDPNPIRLFPDSFWDLAAEDEGEYSRKNMSDMEMTPYKAIVATRAFQTLSFFKAYVGNRAMPASAFEDASEPSTFEDDFEWKLYEGQRIRLALSTAGFVLAVPAYVEVGDVFMRLGRCSSIDQKAISKNDYFGGLLRPLEKDTGDSFAKAFKWLCFGGVPLCKESWYETGDGYGFGIHMMLPNENNNDALKLYDDWGWGKKKWKT
ncbi:HET-domain-containing protein [Colletotrichum asianum]